MRGINLMIKKNFKKAFSCILIFCAFTLISSSKVLAQVDGPQQQEIKWMNVSALHQWFSSGGAEIEYGRRRRSQYVNVDQLDGLRWPGEYIRNKGEGGRRLAAITWHKVKLKLL